MDQTRQSVGRFRVRLWRSTTTTRFGVPAERPTRQRIGTLPPMGYEVKKTEHSGAKNGGGFWGTRADAKEESNQARRVNDRAAFEEDWGE